MTLALKVGVAIAGAYNLAAGALSIAGPLSIAASVGFADGAGAGQANGLYAAAGALGPGETDTLELGDGLVDFWGQDLWFTAIKAIYIASAPSNLAMLQVGQGLWSAPFGDAGGSLLVRPGGAALLCCQDADGWAVLAGADTLLVSSSLAASYSLVLIGVRTLPQNLQTQDGVDVQTEGGLNILL